MQSFFFLSKGTSVLQKFKVFKICLLKNIFFNFLNHIGGFFIYIFLVKCIVSLTKYRFLNIIEIKYIILLFSNII